MTFHVMIIPTLNCPSNCKYCWGSENKREMMDLEIIDQIVEWLGDFRDDLGMIRFISHSMVVSRCSQAMTSIRKHWRSCPHWTILKDFHFKATSGF